MVSNPMHLRSGIRGLLLGLSFGLSPVVALGQTHSGNIVAFDKNGTRGVYVFESSGPRLYSRFISDSDVWEDHWEDHGVPPQRAPSLIGPLGEPAVLTSTPVGIGHQQQQLAAFVIGNGRLYMRRGDGSNWSWTMLGAPSMGTLVREAPAAITYEDGFTRHFVVYVRDTDGNLHKLTRTGSESTWLFLGHPPGGVGAGHLLASGAGVVTNADGGTRRIYAFVQTKSTGLYLNYFNGTTHQWFAHDGAESRPSVITFDVGGVPRIFVFFLDMKQDGDLWVHWSDGTGWHSAHQDDVGHFSGAPHAITYQVNGSRRIFVAMKKGEGPGVLWANVWDGFTWSWIDQMTPPFLRGEVSGAATYELDGVRRLFVVMRAENGDIWVNSYGLGGWIWTNVGQP